MTSVKMLGASSRIFKSLIDSGIPESAIFSSVEYRSQTVFLRFVTHVGAEGLIASITFLPYL